PALPDVDSFPTRRSSDLAVDFATVTDALRGRGLCLIGMGVDPHRAARRVVYSPRYDAMEAYFDADGSAGRTMMCSTAALQVNVEDRKSTRLNSSPSQISY